MGPNANSTNATPFSFLCQNLGWSNYLESRPQQWWRYQQPSLAQHWTGRLHSPHLCHCTNINGAFWARLNNKGRAEEGDPGEFADDKQVRISESNGLHRRGEMWSGRITLRTKNEMISERDLSRTRSHVSSRTPPYHSAENSSGLNEVIGLTDCPLVWFSWFCYLSQTKISCISLSIQFPWRGFARLVVL